MLAATEPAWRANLARLFERMHFVLGEQVAAFEQELAKEWGAKFAVGVGTGTDAIELMIRGAGLGDSGGEILLPALTSPFSAQAVLAAGCKPRFADVDPESLLMDPADAERRIGKRTIAVMPVHLYGQPAPMAVWAKLARSHDIQLLQDACQAHAAESGGKPLTKFSSSVAYSFYPTKNLPCLGDGGALLTNSRAVAERLRSLRDGGRRNDQVSRVRAVNSRLDEMQACYLRAFLPKLGEWNCDRARLASLYDEALAGCPAVTPVKRDASSVCHLYVVRSKRRDRLREYLAKQGVLTGIHYAVPLHLQPAFASGKRTSFPAAERACKEILSLPLWPYMPEAVVAHVADAVLQYFQ